MIADHYIPIRVTGILIEQEHILLVRQHIGPSRDWSLPGGKVHSGETLEAALVREIEEETGLTVRVKKLLYICDHPQAQPSILHITFLVERVEGELRRPTNEFDCNPIHDVQMVAIGALTDHGFSQRFRDLVRRGFPHAGSYAGLKDAI